MTIGSIRIRIDCLTAVLLLCVCGVVAGDTITKRDGTIYIGTVQQENDTWVVIEIDRGGNKVTIPIRKADIRSIKRGGTPDVAPTTTSAPSGPAVCLLPVVGEIGVDVRAEFLAQAFADARKAKADYVVLAFDSPGGSVAEAGRIIDLIRQARRTVHVVALVQRATSSAAAVAMAAPQIYVTPAGRIGDATGAGETAGPGAMTQVDQEAVRTRLLVEAKDAGHPALVARGMVDPSLELSIKTVDGAKALSAGTEGKVVSAKGAPLILRGADAVDAGLAKGLAVGPEYLPKAMGLGPWNKVAGSAWGRTIEHGRDFRRQRDEDARRKAQEDYRRRMEERFNQMEGRQEPPATQPG
ncbi:MAG TPA: ATP-dependent Clp protease proteolytic subunit [Phycisphaerae bacterium]|nr:ATP-dependent Clp protease proteolytic subunit [Phycisphaerae bacterium]